jgi:uncharacterized protein
LFTGKTFHLMKRKLLPHKTTLLTAAVTIMAAAFAAFGQESPLPAPTGFVNDYAGVVDAGTKQQLEAKLKNLKETTNPSVEIAVAVVKTTGDRDILDYSLAVARGWKIGSKDDDNPSALLFVAIDDRKYFTQVSRDLEDELPDGLAGSLQRQYLVPEFKKGNYGKGISDTIDAYIETIRSKGNAPANVNKAQRPSSGTTNGGGGFLGLLCCGGIILIIVLIIISRSKGGPTNGDRNRWGGGGGGGLGGALPWIIGSIISSGLSGGSSSSGSSWGGSSGGGFGGFGGGGDFGGGGAGGSW